MNRAIGVSLVGIVVIASLLAGSWYGDPPVEDVLAGSLINRVVVIDPGHGGPDPGSMGREGSLEKEVVLAVALYLREFLTRAGVQVIMTRTKDVDLSGLDSGPLRQRKNLDLRARSQLMNESQADAALSIHANSIPSGRWYGAQTFYSPENEWSQQSERLAVTVQSELRAITRNTSRVASNDVNQYILEHANLPAVNVEVGFLSNAREERLLATAEYQRRVAWAIFLGTARYFVEGALPAAAAGPAVPVCMRVWKAVDRAGSMAWPQVNPLVPLVPELMCALPGE